MSAEKGPLEAEIEELIRFELTGIPELLEAFTEGKPLRFEDAGEHPLVFIHQHLSAQYQLLRGHSKALKRIAQEIDRLNGS
jgi:hypothetical protein